MANILIWCGGNELTGEIGFCHNSQRMWDLVTHVLSRVLTIAWFAGAVLMILTIPACAVKIFSALWEDSDEEDQAVYEGVRKR